MSDPDGHTEALCQSAYRVGEAGGVQATGVGDDAHPAVGSQPQALLELGQEGLGVAAFGMFHPVAAEDQHGQLGQVVTGDVVELAADQHLAHRRMPVAVEARTVSDPNRCPRTPGIRRGRHALAPSSRTYQPTGRLAGTGSVTSRALARSRADFCYQQVSDYYSTKRCCRDYFRGDPPTRSKA